MSGHSRILAIPRRTERQWCQRSTLFCQESSPPSWHLILYWERPPICRNTHSGDIRARDWWNAWRSWRLLWEDAWKRHRRGIKLLQQEFVMGTIETWCWWSIHLPSPTCCISVQVSRAGLFGRSITNACNERTDHTGSRQSVTYSRHRATCYTNQSCDWHGDFSSQFNQRAKQATNKDNGSQTHTTSTPSYTIKDSQKDEKDKEVEY